MNTRIHPRRWWGVRHARFAVLRLRFERDKARTIREAGDIACIPWGDLDYAYGVLRGEV
ncbi:MAG TPA: hypothetical protein VFI96_09170 [Longimicrobiaceae bacterium]|nr:hypothetical protein [Longimicrobiaceae bacterium]